MFDSSSDFSPGQHAIFQEFVSLCDELLEDTLRTLGCDGETFVKLLEMPELQVSHASSSSSLMATQPALFRSFAILIL